MIDEAADIVKGIVDSMDSTIIGKVNNALGKNTFCETKWARKGKRIQNLDTGFVFNMIYVQPDEYIDAVPIGAGTFGSGLYELPKPYFISGTKLAANREWTIAGNDLTAKTPIIWLLETIRERFFGRGDARDREMELRLFFLDETNVAQFYTEDHRREVVYPMQKMVDEFIATIGRNRNFKTIEDYSIRSFSRFGVEQDNGMFQNILDANLSGVELNITLTKYKANCNPNCIR